MDYWVGFYSNEELIASFVVKDCVSEVVAASQSIANLTSETGANKWVTDPTKRMVISQNLEEVE